MLDTIEITSKSRVYIGEAGALLAELLPEKRVIVISDTGVDCLQHGLLAPYDTILVGRGESAKSLAMLDGIYRRLIELGADRSSFILGVGGGVVTDIAGFVASTYMRGVEFGFVTTT
jgi:3-dehydroquinate synthase